MSTALERGEHGTATTYRQGCRCGRCRSALRRRAKVWWATRRLRQGADPATRVAAARMLGHVDELVAAGWSTNRVALAAGIAPSTIGRARVHGRVSRIVERRVLDVTP